MIGQENLKRIVEEWIDNDLFPRFSIFVGPGGSGKKTLVREVIKSLTDGMYVESGIRADDIREIIAQSYKVHSLAVYFIPDADKMSNAAKNALLKVIEEPPNNAYFIMTLEDEANTLPTILSRGIVFKMERYTPYELTDYALNKYSDVKGESWKDVAKSICETPGDVDLLMSYGVYPFYDYVQLVVDNIAEVSLANAFKISDKIALKDKEEGYDLKLFWKAFIKVVLEKAMNPIDPEDISRYGEVAIKTSKYLQRLRIAGINRGMLFDNWILEIRDCFK